MYEKLLERFEEMTKDVGKIKEKYSIIKSDIDKLEDRLNRLDRCQHGTEQRVNSIDERLGKIEDTLKWMNRLVLAAVVLAVLNLVVVSNGGG